MKFEILSSRGDEKEVLAKIQFEWTKSILEQTGIDWTDCYPEDSDPKSLTIEQRALIRKKLKENNIKVIDEKDESINIYITDEVIAKFHKPNYVLVYDASKIEPSERWHVKINIECWSVFDEEL